MIKNHTSHFGVKRKVRWTCAFRMFIPRAPAKPPPPDTMPPSAHREAGVHPQPGRRRPQTITWSRHFRRGLPIWRSATTVYQGLRGKDGPYSEHSSTSKNGCPKNSPASRLTPLSQHETPCHSCTKCATLQLPEISDSENWRLPRCPPHDVSPLALPDCQQPPGAVCKIQSDPDAPPRNLQGHSACRPLGRLIGREMKGVSIRTISRVAFTAETAAKQRRDCPWRQ